MFSRWLRRGGWAASSVASGLAIVLIDLVAFFSAIRAFAQPINQLTQPGGTVSIEIVEAASAIPSGAPGVTLERPPSGFLELHVAELPSHLRFLSELGPAIGYLGWAVGAWLLARALTAITGGSPFQERVPRLMIAIGVVLVIAPTLSAIVQQLASEAVYDYAEPIGLVVPFGMVFGVTNALIASIDTMIIGVAVLVVAAAFRQGRQMATDLEGVV